MLLFTEGFDWTTTIGDFVTYSKWAARNGWNTGNTTATLRFGASSGNYLTSNDPSHYFTKAIGSNLATGVVGIAIRVDFSGTNAYRFSPIGLFDGATTPQLAVIVNTDLTLSLVRGSVSNVLGTTTYTLTTGTWAYLELKFKINNSITSGDVVLYADGVAILTLSTSTDTQATGNAYASYYVLGGSNTYLSGTGGASATNYVDDLYICDLTGSVNNAPLGSVRVQTLLPSGDGGHSQFTGSDGNSTNNSLLVDDPSTNTTDYVEDGTVGHKDTYAFGDTVSTTTTIYGVVTNMVAIKTDVGARGVTDEIRISSTDYDGSAIALTNSYVNYQTIHETNPATSSGWTKSDVDGAEFGIRVDS